jgi:carbamoyltransferase
MYLGINAFSHDASAALIDSEGRVIAAVEEERFSRRKRENRFPCEAISFCLSVAGITTNDLMGIGLAWHPWLLLYDRIIWEDLLLPHVKRKHLIKDVRKAYDCFRLKRHFEERIGPLKNECKVRFFRHHLAHAASAYFGSSFDEAAYLTIDGRGERETVTWGDAREIHFKRYGALKHPNSLGNFYSGMARFCGFHNSDLEGTAMAFAGIGQPSMTKLIRRILGLPTEGGNPLRIALNTRWMDCGSGEAFPTSALAEFLGVPQRESESKTWVPYSNISSSAQAVLEEMVMSLAFHLKSVTKSTRLVMAGGVALNSVANGRLSREGPFDEVFYQPATHDAGLALGCGLLLANKGRTKRLPPDDSAPFFGPEFNRNEILRVLENSTEITFDEVGDIVDLVADSLATGKIIAWFQGRLEFGPRALGNRSLLADPRDKQTTQRLNHVKGRQSFRPFAVSILHEYRNEWLSDGFESPYMLLVDRLKQSKTEQVPAAMHKDGSVRTQTVLKSSNLQFYKVIHKFFRKTRIPMIVNTSLNVRGEPLACTPGDAIRTLLSSDIDAMAIGPFWVERKTCR